MNRDRVYLNWVSAREIRRLHLSVRLMWSREGPGPTQALKILIWRARNPR